MNKTTFYKLFLILLPVMAVILATTGDSVTVFDKATSATVYGSYFALIPEAGNAAILPPLAAMTALACAVLSIVYVVSGKPGCMSALRWTSAVSTCASAMPVVLQGQVLVVPHVLLPILMAALFLLTLSDRKNPRHKDKRLEKK